VPLARVRARIATGDLEGADADLDALAAADPLDWRVTWLRGVGALAGNRPATARAHFADVFATLPGELAPQLALAAAYELAGDVGAAERFYRRVWRTDPGYLSAAFGLARLLLAGGDRAAATGVLDAVPEQSRHHRTAQVAAARARVHAEPDALRADDLTDAAERLLNLDLDPGRRARLIAEILHVCLRWSATPRRQAETATVFGLSISERSLRSGLERAYRTLAALAPEEGARVALVDQANAVRPRTLT
jgi:serine/threonine-protein kinase PknG